MINLLVGLQGAGKTYYAVAEAWKHIKLMHQAEISGSTYKYKKIYTNIEGFKPNKYVEQLDMAKLSSIWKWELAQYLAYEKRYSYKVPDNIPFDVEIIEKPQSLPAKHVIDDDVKEHRKSDETKNDIEIFDNNDLKLLEAIEDPLATVDPEFIQYTMSEFENQGFTNCLFIIDEAHNFFGNGMKAELSRLLSYHRHYHGQDYILISQDHKMFNFKVCQLATYSIRAINPIMRWRSDIFTYKIYSGGWISFSGENKLETKKLKAKEVVFNLYNSGGKVLQKSHLAKILLKMLAGFIVILIIGKLALGNYTHDYDKIKIEDNNTTVTINKPVEEKKEVVQDLREKTFTEVFIIIGDSIIHKRTHKKFKFKSFDMLLDDEDQPISYNENMDGTVTVYYDLKKSTLETLDIRREDEKNTNVFSVNSN